MINQDTYQVVVVLLLGGILWQVANVAIAVRALAHKLWETSNVQANNIFSIERHLNGMEATSGLHLDKLEAIQTVLSDIRSRR